MWKKGVNPWEVPYHLQVWECPPGQFFKYVTCIVKERHMTKSNALLIQTNWFLTAKSFDVKWTSSSGIQLVSRSRTVRVGCYRYLEVGWVAWDTSKMSDKDLCLTLKHFVERNYQFVCVKRKLDSIEIYETYEFYQAGTNDAHKCS